METMERDLGERVLIYRRRLKMSQEAFADYLRRNGLQARKWTAADVSELENEKLDPRLSELKDLAFAMHTTVEALTTVDEAKGAQLRSNRDNGRYIIPDWHPANLFVKDEWHYRDTIDIREPLQVEQLPIAVGF